MSGTTSGTPNLGIVHVAQNQNSKEVTINSALDALDNAANAVADISFASVTAFTLTGAAFAGATMFRCQGLTAASTLTVPTTMREFTVRNESGSYALTVGGVSGATVSVPASTTCTLQNDGTDTVLVGSSASAAGAAVAWTQMPAEAQQLPLGFVLPGKPAVSAVFHLVMAMAVVIPANFAGTVAYAGTVASANATFTLNHISGATTTEIGTIIFNTTGHTAIALSTQAAVSVAAGDVLQLVAPALQDATLADLGLTILTGKV